MIDLHMHTTASDGLLSASALVARVVLAGVTTISVTDHDTLAGLAEARAHADAAGIQLVPGIEVTSVHDGRDVHILGYFIDESDAVFARFLWSQREQRFNRAREICARLAALGVPVAAEALIAAASRHPGTSIGRPAIADAMMRDGQVANRQEAFDRFLAAGRPAFVPRLGLSPQAVVEAIHAAGGLASFAHPGVTQQPQLLEPLAAAGLDAIEAYHSDHTEEMREEALQTARRLRLAVTGGSDYHGDDLRRALGGIALPQPHFEEFLARRRT